MQLAWRLVRLRMVALARYGWDRRRLGPLVIVCFLILAICSVTLANSIAYAQDGGNAVGTPDAVEIPVEEPTNLATFEPEEINEPSADGEVTPLEEPAGDVTVDTPPTEPVAQDVPPVVVVSPESSILCAVADQGIEESIHAGATLDYRCTYSVSLSGDIANLAEVRISFSVVSTMPDGYALRFRTNPFDASTWSEPFQHQAHLEASAIDPGAMSFSGSPVGPLSGTMTLTFFVRLERDACSTPEGALTLTPLVSASASHGSDVSILTKEPDFDLTYLQPALYALPSNQPEVRITHLAVDPVRFSLVDQATIGSVTIEIVNAVYRCSGADIALAINRDSLQTALLQDISTQTDGFAASGVEAGTLMNQDVIVGSVPAGTGAGTFQLTVSFELLVPAGLAAGAVTVTVDVAAKARTA